MTKVNKGSVRCYDCGESIKKEEFSKEHIPMRCLYTGFEDIIVPELVIKVPAHEKCNHDYSCQDVLLRDFIALLGYINKTESLKDLIAASFRGLKYNRKEFIKWFNFDLENRVTVKPLLDDLHIKHFKGLFLHEFGFPIEDNFQYSVNSHYNINEIYIDEYESDGLKNLIKIGMNMANLNYNWKYSGHKDIFKYKIDKLSINSNEIEEENVIICIMFYHNLLYTVVVAIKGLI